jgi:hypothetical protein
VGACAAAGVIEAGHTNEPPAAGVAAGTATGAEPESPAADALSGVASGVASGAAGAAATVAAGSVLPHAWQLVCPRKTSLAPQNWHV